MLYFLISHLVTNFDMNVGLDVYFFTYMSAVIIGIPLLILGKVFPERIKIKDLPMAPFMAIGTVVVYYLM
ncbi:prepilin signal peptidase PulO-like enzyme (type II secretory pathway) [Virgibacillus halotolerans]|nr:prepilin signal peptidase PulO-like enzyme (type II secretory pathway) [Virgibacillus halotolerans]